MFKYDNILKCMPVFIPASPWSGNAPAQNLGILLTSQEEIKQQTCFRLFTHQFFMFFWLFTYPISMFFFHLPIFWGWLVLICPFFSADDPTIFNRFSPSLVALQPLQPSNDHLVGHQRAPYSWLHHWRIHQAYHLKQSIDGCISQLKAANQRSQTIVKQHMNQYMNHYQPSLLSKIYHYLLTIIINHHHYYCDQN